MKLTSIFTDQKILESKGKNIPINQITSNQVQNLTNELLKHLDSLNLAAITPQNIFPNPKNTTLEDHLLNILIFRDENQNPQVIYNPKIINQSKTNQINYERCGSIQIDEELTFDTYVQRPQTITLLGHTIKGNKFQKTYLGETAAYILHELDHLNGTTISDRNKKLTPKQIKQIDPTIQPKLLIKENGQWKMYDRTNENQQIPSSINFDYCDEFHRGIESQLRFLK